MADEGSNTQEVVHHLSQIRMHYRNGLVWWSYDVDDESAKHHGLRLSNESLPKANFTLIPASPDPLPSIMTVSVGSFWSLNSISPGPVFPLKPRLPVHMNLYQQIVLQIPSDLAVDSHYMETNRAQSGKFELTVELPGDVCVKSLFAAVKLVPEDGDLSQGEPPAERFRN
jgi:hypothetical protein